jgi:hypothetical protein
MNYKKLQIITFLSLLVLGLLFALAVFWPFLNIIALAAILAILFIPLMRRIQRKVKSQSIAAGLTVLCLVLIVVIPIALFGKLLFSEISDLVQKINTGALTLSQDQVIESLPQVMQDGAVRLTASLNDLALKYTSNIFQSFFHLLSNVASFFISVFLTLFTIKTPSVFIFISQGVLHEKFVLPQQTYCLGVAICFIFTPWCNPNMETLLKPCPCSKPQSHTSPSAHWKNFCYTVLCQEFKKKSPALPSKPCKVTPNCTWKKKSVEKAWCATLARSVDFWNWPHWSLGKPLT